MVFRETVQPPLDLYPFDFRVNSLNKWLLSQPEKWRCRLSYMYKRCEVGDVDGSFLEKLFTNQSGLCIYCSRTEPLWVQHLTPIRIQGANLKCNIVLACRSCSAKRAKPSFQKYFHTFQLPLSIKELQGICPPILNNACVDVSRILDSERTEYRKIKINGVETEVPVRVFDSPPLKDKDKTWKYIRPSKWY